MGQLTGAVLDGESGAPIQGASLALWLSTGNYLGEATTGEEGVLRLSVMELYDDRWELQGELSRPGYVPTTLHQTVQILNWRAAAVDGRPAHVVEPTAVGLPPFLLAREHPEAGSVSGRVFNALIDDQAEGLSGLTVELREGINAPDTATVVATTVTTRDGASAGDDNYQFTDIPPGTYTVAVEGGGEYINASINTVVLGGRALGDRDLGLSPTLEPDQFRAVLTWGETPADLDSHIVGPMPPDSAEAGFHVYYAKSADPDGGAVCFLDVDDTTSFGPETVTVRTMTEGTYRYAVHDYTNRGESASSAMSASGARVQLFYDIDQSQVFDIPTGQVGTVWEVFVLDGEEGAVVPINRFTSESSPAQVLAY